MQDLTVSGVLAQADGIDASWCARAGGHGRGVAGAAGAGLAVDLLVVRVDVDEVIVLELASRNLPADIPTRCTNPPLRRLMFAKRAAS